MPAKRLFVSISSAMLLCACGNNSQSIVPETPSPENEPVVAVFETVPDPNKTASTPATSAARHADRHVHGNAELAIVLDKTTLLIELDTPLYNLTGFEHIAETDAQRAALERAEMLLEQPVALFHPSPDAACTVQNGNLDAHLGEFEHADHGGSHNKYGDQEEAHKNQPAHKDVLIAYTFSCVHPELLTEVRTTILTEFPDFSELHVVYLGPNRQEQFTLHGSDTVIKLLP